MTREDIICKMQDAGLKAPARGDSIFIHWDQIAMLLEHERAAEREAAEERVTDLFADMETPYLPDIVAAIRARKENT